MRNNWTHHLDTRIELTVELGKENTFMVSLPNHIFEHGNLIGKVILFTENARHAAIIVLKRTDWCAFGTKSTHVEATLFESLLELLLLPRFRRHLLDSAMVFWKWVGFWRQPQHRGCSGRVAEKIGNFLPCLFLPVNYQ